VARLLLDDCTQILADTQQQVDDYSGMWSARETDGQVHPSLPEGYTGQVNVFARSV
jgi:hypothetical protein